MENMPAVIFAAIVGTAIGLALHFQKAITKGCTVIERGISEVFGDNIQRDAAKRNRAE